jgi:hypothetical protein
LSAPAGRSATEADPRRTAMAFCGAANAERGIG